jgi:hypothetical protein
MSSQQSMTEQELDQLQRAAFNYFLQTVNPANGLISDTSRENSPCSIGVVGFALSTYPVWVERGWMTRAEANRTRARDATILSRQQPERRPAGQWFQGVLLSLPRHADRRPRLALEAVESLRVIVSKFVGSEAESALRRSVFRRALRELPTEGGGEMRSAGESAG